MLVMSTVETILPVTAIEVGKCLVIFASIMYKYIYYIII